MLDSLLNALRSYLPPPIAGLPLPNLSAVSVVDRTVGLGNRRGNETRGGFTVVALKGGRLDAVVRFQVWGNQPSEVEGAIALLRNNLDADKTTLRSQGFLRFGVQSTSPVEFNPALNAWSGVTDYQVLYEFYSDDSEGAESLIARIAIDVNSAFGESTAVTDHLVRWDDQAARCCWFRGHACRRARVGGHSRRTHRLRSPRRNDNSDRRFRARYDVGGG
ncbi:MAG: hypothetical protein HC936_12615, partial [Leptolyngbyaceae cyanobacterium SU_3_3]|nr:hypothetical protein [Leptolyngbyaceae cyanobacterium SU_3_3]